MRSFSEEILTYFLVYPLCISCSLGWYLIFLPYLSFGEFREGPIHADNTSVFVKEEYPTPLLNVHCVWGVGISDR